MPAQGSGEHPLLALLPRAHEIVRRHPMVDADGVLLDDRPLIQVAGRVANQARRWRLHLPTRWPWHDELDTLYTAAQDPPALTAS